MNELKAITVIDAYQLECDDNDLVYLKSEADKVIAELKEIAKGLSFDNYLKDKETRHNKYKRCLAMASYWVAVSYQCVDDKHRQRAERHHRKWLELAKKFKDKEAK